MRSPSLPTTRVDWRRMGWAARRVLSRPGWLLVALIVAVAAPVLFAALDSPVYVRTVVLGGDLSPLDRLLALASLRPSLAAGGRTIRALLLYLTAVAVGANVAMLGYQLRHNRAGIAAGSGSAAGVALGVLGAGCASCGVAVLASALSLVGVSASLTALPLGGLEFLLLALVVAVLSIHWTARGLAAGDVEGCPIDA